MEMTEEDFEARTIAAMLAYGRHPSDWPFPCEIKPRFWQRKGRSMDREVTKVFGRFDEADRRAFWKEIRKGQGIYEDAGGFLLRAYRAFVNLPVEPPYTLDEAINDRLTA